MKDTEKAVYAGDFQLVFELCQLLESIDMNSWHSSKTSWKWPAQSASPVDSNTFYVSWSFLICRAILIRNKEAINVRNILAQII